MELSKEQQAMYPKVMIARCFKEDSDIRDSFNLKYATETTVENRREENRFYEGLNHESNLVIMVKLPDGVII